MYGMVLTGVVLLKVTITLNVTGSGLGVRLTMTVTSSRMLLSV